ncbi:SH3 domain-containing protein [Candidatus Latescibacterota bacterium]
MKSSDNNEKRHYLIIILFIMIVFNVISTTGSSFAQNQSKLSAAPDIVPPATKEMQYPEFWISRIQGDPDRVIMTQKQIKNLNNKNRTRLPQKTLVDGTVIPFPPILDQANFSRIFFNIADPLTLQSFPGDSLRAWFQKSSNYIKDGNFWDRRHIPYPEQTKQELIATINEKSVPPTVNPQYGIVVKHTLNRYVPTHDRVYTSQYGWLDMFQNAVFETGMPVAVLHRSADGSWFYVKSEYAYGWIPTDHVAIGTTDQIRKLSDQTDFIVSITHKVPVYSDRNCTMWIRNLYMGSKLRLTEKTVDGYKVLLPWRMADGTLKAVTGWLKPDAEVSTGFQTFTQRNVITTIFKLLNRPYAWGGTEHERDCVGTIRAVFRTFGINMPRMTTYELYSTDHVTAFTADTPKEEKHRYLDTCPPGITVCGFDWHVVLYLGKVNGIHYIIHQNGYSYHDDDGNEIRVGRVSVNHTELEGGANIGEWTELSVFKP